MVFSTRQCQVLFLFCTLLKLALGPTHPAIQWVREAVSPGVNRPGREAYHSSPSSSEVKNACTYTVTPQAC
jgi:hypothetical protein